MIGTLSPASRGLHSLTAAAAAPRPPLPQQQATAVGDIGGEPAMYLYGGAPQSGLMYDDLWILNLESITWRQLTPEGPSPQVIGKSLCRTHVGCLMPYVCKG